MSEVCLVQRLFNDVMNKLDCIKIKKLWQLATTSQAVY